MQNKHWKRKAKTAVRRLACAVLSAVTALTVPTMTAFAKPEWPSDTGIQSECGIVMDMDSGAVLFGQGIHVAKAPASITKLLTALVVLESDKTKLDDMVTFTSSALNNVDPDSGNKMSLEEGDTLSVEDCLYSLMLISVNQSGNALAEYVAGSQEAFVDLMNKKAQELGCGENTHFANASGLSDDEQYTTAYDMALIGKAAFENPELLKIMSTKNYKTGATKNNPEGFSFEVEHKLVSTTDPNSEYYYPYAVAGKTGFTRAAGQTLVTLAEKDGRRLITVTLKSTDFTHYKDTVALMNFGFDRFENLNIAENETLISSVEGPIELGGVIYEQGDLSVGTAGAVTVPRGAAFTDLTHSIDAQLPEEHPTGAVARLVYKYDDRVVGTAYIISAKKAQEEATASQGGESGSQEPGTGTSGTEAGESGADKDGTNGGSKKPGFKFKLPKALGPVLIVIFVAAVLIGGGVFFLMKRREAERKRLEERKRRRMQRLRDIGCSEEEFNKMLEDRINRGRKR